MRLVSTAASCAMVIPTRDRSSRLLATLKRISETPGPDVEVVVVDNGSVDRTPQKITDAFPEVHVIELNKNHGAAARNRGAQAAKSPIVFMLDDDSGPLPGTVENVMEALRDPSIGSVACHVILPDGAFEEGGSRHILIGCGAAFRKNVFLDLGGYEQEYEVYVEEYDLCYRLLANGLSIQFLDDCRVWHEPEARGSFDYMVEKLISNNAYLAAKFFPPAEASNHIAWMIYRYSVFAQKKHADSGFRRAMEQLSGKILRGLSRRQELPDRVLDLVIPRRNSLPAFISLAAENVKHISFFRAGKEISGLIKAARDADLKVDMIYELKNGLFANVGHILDVPIAIIDEHLDKIKSDRIVIGGTSSGFISNSTQIAENYGLKDLVVP